MLWCGRLRRLPSPSRQLPCSPLRYGLPPCSPLRFASHMHGSQITSPAGGGKCKFVLRPKVGGKAKFFRASPYHSPDLYPRADTWLPPRGHEQRPRPADETGSCEWRSALVFASARRGAPQKSAKRKRSWRDARRAARLRGERRRGGAKAPKQTMRGPAFRPAPARDPIFRDAMFLLFWCDQQQKVFHLSSHRKGCAHRQSLVTRKHLIIKYSMVRCICYKYVLRVPEQCNQSEP